MYNTTTWDKPGGLRKYIVEKHQKMSKNMDIFAN